MKIYQLTLAALLPYYHITGNLVAPDIGDVLEEVEDSEASVMVTVIINNHSGHTMVLEEVDIGCGMISNNSALPEILDPDSSYIVYTEKVETKTFLSVLFTILKVFIMIRLAIVRLLAHFISFDLLSCVSGVCEPAGHVSQFVRSVLTKLQGVTT